MIKCKECQKTSGQVSYRWAHFDKEGNVVRGECVHGKIYEVHGFEERDMSQDVVSDFKVFVSGGIV